MANGWLSAQFPTFMQPFVMAQILLNHRTEGKQTVCMLATQVRAEGFMKWFFLRIFSMAKISIRPGTEQKFHRRLEHGFTVVELVVIVAIIAGLIALSTLTLPEWRANITLKATAREVISSFQFARVEAAKRNATASIQVTKGGAGTGKCQVIIGGQTLREVALTGRLEVTQLEQPLGTTVMGSDATYQLSNRGFPLGSPGKITLSNGNRSYDIELKPAGGISLNGPY